jgi:Mce-associated membrane protein
VISDARAHPPVEDEDTSDTDERPEDGTAEGAAKDGPGTDEPADDGVASDESAPRTRSREKKAARRAERAAAVEAAADVEEADGEEAPRRRASIPLVPVLAVLLVLLLAGAGFLWFTRTESSSVTTGDYVQVLQEARADVVDFTSFDYLTLDDDIRQIRRVAQGKLADEAADQLDSRRKEITDAEAVVNTEIVAAGVTRANADDATVLMVIQTTRKTKDSQQAQVVKYRIEVQLKKSGDRWLLDSISGA